MGSGKSKEIRTVCLSIGQFARSLVFKVFKSMYISKDEQPCSARVSMRQLLY